MLVSDMGFARSMFKGVIKCNCGLKLSLEISTCIILTTEGTYQQEAQSQETPSSTESRVLVTSQDFAHAVSDYTAQSRSASYCLYLLDQEGN